jgi:hypothetical protein
MNATWPNPSVGVGFYPAAIVFDDSIIWLLGALIATLLMFGSFCAYLAGRYMRNNSSALKTGQSGSALANYSSLLFPFSREGCWRWLAIKSQNPLVIQEAFKLHKATPCKVGDAIEDLSDRRIFISPPTNGWVMVFGAALPDPVEDVDHCFHFLSALSERLGHVQFFTVDRLNSHHGWAMVENGQVVRAYAWSGKTIWNQGELTIAEKELKMVCLGYDEPSRQENPSRVKSQEWNAEKISSLAGRWGLDPAVIFRRQAEERRGILGELPRMRHG